MRNFTLSFIIGRFGSTTAFHIPIIQRFSIATSTITIILLLSNFIAKNRRQLWISRKLPPLASLVPIACLLTAAIVGATMQWRFYYQEDYSHNYPTWQIQHIRNFCALNITSAVFTILALCQPFASASPPIHGKWWGRIIRTSIHFLLNIASLTFIITCATGYLDLSDTLGHFGDTYPDRPICRSVISKRISDQEIDQAFNFVMFCYGAHFLLGLFI